VGREPWGGRPWKGTSSTPDRSCSRSRRAYRLRFRFQVTLEVCNYIRKTHILVLMQLPLLLVRIL
jgi:hypothetical protein